MNLVPGTVLAHRFEITGPPLGSGASGVVWPVLDKATGDRRAAKVLHDDRVGDAQAVERLQREASTMGRLRHPRILEGFGLWSDGDGRWILVTERIDGVALSQVDTALEPTAVVTLGIQLAEALEAAHERGIVHGDVRPGNVLVAPEGCKLFDFGLVVGEATLLRAGQTAPEVLRGGPARVPADLYGLGVVLYRAMTGQAPFYGHTPWAVMKMQHDGRGRVPGPRGLARLVEALLHPDPVERPQTATEVRRALEALRADPGRRSWRGARRTPPIAPGRAWVVHGIDPTHGGRAWMARDLSGATARRMVARLRHAGWDVRADRLALSRPDIVWVAAAALVGGAIVPVLGVVVALPLALWWRSSKVRPALVEALPACAVELPPRVVHSNLDLTLAAGFLLLVAAGLLAYAPAFAAIPAVALIALALHSGRRSAEDPDLAELASTARVQSALADLRARLDGRELDLDRSLGVRGELEAIRGRFEAGEIGAESVLLRLDALSDQLRDAPRLPDMSQSADEALRRVRESS